MAVSGRLEEVVDVLRANGRRVTTPRRAILRALIDHGEHPTAEELTSAVQARHPDVHASTIYRFLEDLEELAIVSHVHIGHGPAVYHFAEDKHHHLVCDSCGAVTELPDHVFDQLRHDVLETFGFETGPHHFALPGRCRRCRRGPRPRRSRPR